MKEKRMRMISPRKRIQVRKKFNWKNNFGLESLGSLVLLINWACPQQNCWGRAIRFYSSQNYSQIKFNLSCGVTATIPHAKKIKI